MQHSACHRVSTHKQGQARYYPFYNSYDCVLNNELIGDGFKEPRVVPEAGQTFLKKTFHPKRLGLEDPANVATA